MGFQERVTIYIETKADQAKSSLAGFRQSVAQAEGATGKLKAAASGVGEAIGGVLSSPAGLAAAGTAIVGVAAKAVAAFQDLGIAVGKFSDATGTSAEEASRLVEVFADLGISPDTAAAAIGRMSKTLETNAETLEKYGIEAVKAADGTTDVNETFIAAVDAISKIKNPTEQATAAQAAFGRSWQQMSEVVTGGAPALRRSLESVGDAKVLDDADVESARELRDALDSLRDAGEGLAIALGKSLAPAISAAVEDMGPLLEAVGKLSTALGDFNDAAGKTRNERGFLDNLKRSVIDGINPIDNLKHKWEDMSELWSDPKIKANVGDIAVATEDVAVATGDAGKAAAKAEADVKRFADAQKDLEKWVRDALDALQDQTDALAEQAGAFTTAADDQLAYNESLAKFNEINKDNEATTEDVRDAAIASAKAHQALYESLTDASGATATATGKIDAQNSALLASAATARGPARQAILDYIGTLNGIPPDKMTAIIAAVEADDLETAKRLLDEASASRETAFIADANNAALAQTNADLDAAAHSRTVLFNAQAVGLAALTGAFTGAIRAAGGTTAPSTTTVHITMPRGANGREIDAAIARHARVNGRINALRRP